MSELGRHIFVRMIERLWEFAKDKAEQKRIERMTPEERENYYVEEDKKIHERAVGLQTSGANSQKVMMQQFDVLKI